MFDGVRRVVQAGPGTTVSANQTHPMSHISTFIITAFSLTSFLPLVPLGLTSNLNCFRYAADLVMAWSQSSVFNLHCVGHYRFHYMHFPAHKIAHYARVSHLCYSLLNSMAGR